MFVVQTGANINSRFVELNIFSLCSPSASMMGTISGNNVEMTMILSSSNTTGITATVFGDTMNGSFTSSGSCDGGDTGNFSASLIPSLTSSQWSGSITQTPASPILVTANLNEDQTGILTGSVSLSGSGLPAPCNSPINITGQIIGRFVSFGDSQGLLQEYGEVDSTGKNITDQPVSAPSGSCVPGSNGAFSITRP